MLFFFLMLRRPPRSTRTDTPFPYTTLFRSYALSQLASAAFGCGQSCTGRPAGHRSELFHLGVEETLAPQIDRLEIGWTKEARDVGRRLLPVDVPEDRKSTRLNSSH